MAFHMCTACGALISGRRLPGVCPQCALSLREFGAACAVRGPVAIGDPLPKLRAKLGPIPTRVYVLRGAIVGSISGLLVGLPFASLAASMSALASQGAGPWSIIFWLVSGMIIGMDLGYGQDFECDPRWPAPLCMSAVGAIGLVSLAAGPRSTVGAMGYALAMLLVIVVHTQGRTIGWLYRRLWGAPWELG